ncbi:mediator of RNA polymerase II transcription subunit 10-like isoform X2 [Acropora millepora]|uniref:mediator of RNA polymerase II transcription subunit 10-like isoform X2 n=1 Tax=Acropora millepora TaxID=45264 RepID=UPI0010FC8B3C|nr:mediator of RNA polymerase II transcription subunit 10-like isoform X2 [Acropora millepora]
MKVNSKMVDDKVPERFELLGQTIEQFVETTRQIGIIVSDFQHGSQGVLNQKMYIDQGRNPQLYTKDCLEKAQEKNQQVNGKIDAYKDFRSLLVDELSKQFPKELEEYQQIKQRQSKP